MKHLILLLTLLISSVVSANLETTTFKDGLLIDPGTDEPFTGNIELINTDWNTVEFSQDYVDGLLHGQERGFYQSGRLKSIGGYEYGLVGGVTKVFYENGTLMIIMQAKNNIREGRYLSFYPNGRTQIEKFYQNDKIHGQERVWFDNGNPMTSRHYFNGVLVGQVSTYYESGRLFERSRVKDGELTNTLFYKEDGTLYDEKYRMIMLNILK
jgi:antitoxin component YwqK of YwqJK toxin-antitoxin module